MKLLLSLLLLAGCAVVPTNPNSSSLDSKSDRSNVVKAEKAAERVALADTEIDQIENLTIDDVLKVEEPNTQALYDNSRYDFPITLNAKVEAWIDYFTGRGRPHMERYLSRSSRYIPAMKQILKKEGVPEDLVYLALIESGFNMRAYSRARAVGPWQFISGTGKRYGLKIDFWIDERRDPIRSTEAAARYLKDLYLMFESWYLAAAAYNAGENRILRAISSSNTNNYWHISKTRLIRRETKDYVPKLIAAAIIAKNAKKFGFDLVEYQKPLNYDVVNVNYSVHIRDIASLVDADQDAILDLNPELRRGMVPPKIEQYPLRVPQGTQALVTRALIAKKEDLNKPVLPVSYRVQRGDNLSTIARRFGVRIEELTQINNLNSTRIYPGRLLVIPKEIRPGETADVTPARPTRKVASKEAPSGKFIYHKIKPGESLWSIAEQYNVTVESLFRWNKLKRSRIFPGRKLKVKPKDSTLASSGHSFS